MRQGDHYHLSTWSTRYHVTAGPCVPPERRRFFGLLFLVIAGSSPGSDLSRPRMPASQYLEKYLPSYLLRSSQRP